MNRDTQRRFAYIETCVYWEGGITARQLGATFEIARQNAQITLNTYRELHPDNLRYNSSRKCHEATDHFQTYYIKNKPDIYLNYLRGNHLSSHFWAEESWAELNITDVDSLFRPHLNQQIVRKVVSAIQNQHTVQLYYHAKLGGFENITIAPSHLVYASRRYHIRAYCYERNKFIDLVLSRIGEITTATEAWVSSEEDQDWCNYVTLAFEPNPALPEPVKQTLCIDFHVQDNVFLIKTRKALQGYVLREIERVDWFNKMPLWIEKKANSPNTKDRLSP